MIKVITGAVSSGKSKKLIEYYNQLKDCGVAVFSSKFSLAHGEEVVSRYGTSIKAIPINSLFDIPHHIGHKTINYILIDEFQFLQMKSFELKAFFDMHYNKYDFYIFGLNMDYKQNPFKLTSYVMSIADEVEVLHRECDNCHQPNSKSRYSMRLENGVPSCIDDEGELILLDGEDKDNTHISYIAVCDDCWRELYYNFQK